jgi:hypothetical protein
MHYATCSLVIIHSLYFKSVQSFTDNKEMSIGLQLQCLKQYANGLYSLSELLYDVQ